MPRMTPEELEELDRHCLRCIKDFAYYARSNLKVQTEDSQLIPFELNEVQMILEEIWNDTVRQGRMVRFYILKARREGISTWATGKFFYKTSTLEQKNAVLVTHEPPATEFLFEMQKRYYAHLPREFKPHTKKNNARIIHFNNDQGTGLDSAIRVGTAGVKDFGSGQGIHYLHLSEFAKFPAENQRDLFISLAQPVPREKETAVIIESTAKGLGGEFYHGFYNARYVYEVYQDENGVAKWTVRINENADPTNEYAAIFIPWFVFKKYRMEPPAGFTRTAEEEQYALTYNLSDDQLYWYRWVLANKCNGDKNKRDQEYPPNAKSAFIGSGTPAFDINRVMYLKDKCTPPVARYDCLLDIGTFVANAEGPFKVWEEPVAGRPYVISADVAEGLEHGDFDSVDVIDHTTGVQVAHYHGKVSPFQFAILLNWIGKRYNGGWVVPERNNHGITVVEKLQDLDYDNINVEMVEDFPNKPRKRFGFVTTKKSRELILDNLVRVVSEENPGIRCADTYEEMLNFKVQSDGKREADTGTFDDRVMSIAIGFYTMKHLPYVVPTSALQPSRGKFMGERKKPSVLGCS
jgi:hypothetical protein